MIPEDDGFRVRPGPGHTAHASMLADIDVDSNMIYFTPEAGFFPEGPCGLQVRLTGTNQRNLVSFEIPVLCHKDAVDDEGRRRSRPSYRRSWHSSGNCRRRLQLWRR